jgi:predicted SAM-dependent methyltransferase
VVHPSKQDEEIPKFPAEKPIVTERRAPVRINLGCGLITPPGWVHLDASFNAKLAKHPLLRRSLHKLRLLPEDKIAVPWNPTVLIHDVRKPLPFPSDSAGCIYSSHLLEHLYLDEAKRLLSECLRVLAKGGILRIVVPDLRSIIQEYLGGRPFGEIPAGMQNDPPADRVNRRLLLRAPVAPHGGILYRIYTTWKDFHSHKWMYDAESLAFHFESAGFCDVQPMGLHQSRIAGIEAVEDVSRIIKGEGISIEGTK